MSTPIKCFFSYKHGVNQENHKKVCLVSESIVRRKCYTTYIDTNEISRVIPEIYKGIEESGVFICFLDKAYIDGVGNTGTMVDFCRNEFNHACNHGKIIIPVIMEKDLLNRTWEGPVGATLGNNNIYVDFSDVCEANMHTKVDLLSARICQALESINKDTIVKNINEAETYLKQLNTYDLRTLGGEDAVVIQIKRVVQELVIPASESTNQAATTTNTAITTTTNISQLINICELLKKVLERYKLNTSLARAVCLAIKDMSFSERNRVHLGNVKACSLLCEVLRTYIASADVVIVACDAIAWMSWDGSNKAKFGDIGVCELLCNSLERHLADPCVVKMTSYAIREMSLNNSANSSKLNYWRVCSLLVNALDHYQAQTNCDVIPWICCGIAMLSYDSDLKGRLRDLIRSKESLDCMNIINLVKTKNSSDTWAADAFQTLLCM